LDLIWTKKQNKNPRHEAWLVVLASCHVKISWSSICLGIWLDAHFFFLVKIEKNFEKIKIKNCRGYTIALNVVDKLL